MTSRPVPLLLSAPDGTTRREFCAHACQLASLLAAGALAGCGGGNNPVGPSVPQLPSVPANNSGRTINVVVDAASPLSPVGGVAVIQTPVGAFLASHTTPDAFTVLTATCTHEGCTVTGFQNNTYVCPCHGSMYTTSGSVLTGPATRNLQQFASTFAGGVLTFTV